MKKISIILSGLILAASVAADVTSESTAKVEVQKAKSEFDGLVKNKSLAKYLPYAKTLEADRLLDNAQRKLEDSDYDEASYYATMSLAASQTAKNLAEAWMAEVQILEIERDFYKKKVESDKSWVIIALQAAELKQKGKSKTFSGALDAGMLFGFKKAPNNPDDLPDLSNGGREMLDSISDVLIKQPDTNVELTGFASRERSKSTAVSEAYLAKVKDYLITKGVDSSKIKTEAKGYKKNTDKIEINVNNVDAR